MRTSRGRTRTFGAIDGGCTKTRSTAGTVWRHVSAPICAGITRRVMLSFATSIAIGAGGESAFNAHLGQAVAQSVSGQSQNSRGLALIPVGLFQGVPDQLD